MSTLNPETDTLDATAGTATALARETRSLDDRLTLLQVRMVYIALAFGFACFWFAEVYLQLVNSNNMWRPPGIHQPTPAIGIIEVALIIGAGLVYFWGQWAGLYRRNNSVLTLALWIAAIMGVVAIGFHIYELHHPGLGSVTGPNGNEQLQTGYSSVFTAMEGIYTAFLVPAVIVLIGIANRARLGRFTSNGIAVEAFGEFWGFMAAVALMNFLGLYIQPFIPS